MAMHSAQGLAIGEDSGPGLQTNCIAILRPACSNQDTETTTPKIDTVSTKTQGLYPYYRTNDHDMSEPSAHVMAFDCKF